jgi:hypothetical protein
MRRVSCVCCGCTDAGDSQAPTAPDYCTPASAGHVGQVSKRVSAGFEVVSMPLLVKS